jgi:hypothetical protein
MSEIVQHQVMHNTLKARTESVSSPGKIIVDTESRVIHSRGLQLGHSTIWEAEMHDPRNIIGTPVYMDGMHYKLYVGEEELLNGNQEYIDTMGQDMIANNVIYRVGVIGIPAYMTPDYRPLVVYTSLVRHKDGALVAGVLLHNSNTHIDPSYSSTLIEGNYNVPLTTTTKLNDKITSNIYKKETELCLGSGSSIESIGFITEKSASANVEGTSNLYLNPYMSKFVTYPYLNNNTPNPEVLMYNSIFQETAESLIIKYLTGTFIGENTLDASYPLASYQDDAADAITGIGIQFFGTNLKYKSELGSMPPSLGEMGLIVAKLDTINNALAAQNMYTIPNGVCGTSTVSIENSVAYFVNTANGIISSGLVEEATASWFQTFKI